MVALKPLHDDVIKGKQFPRYSPFVRGINRSPVNFPHKCHWHGALMFSLICVWINGWVNNRETGDLKRYRAHYDVTVMTTDIREITNNMHVVRRIGCVIPQHIVSQELNKHNSLPSIANLWYKSNKSQIFLNNKFQLSMGIRLHFMDVSLDVCSKTM